MHLRMGGRKIAEIACGVSLALTPDAASATEAGAFLRNLSINECRLRFEQLQAKIPVPAPLRTSYEALEAFLASPANELGTMDPSASWWKKGGKTVGVLGRTIGRALIPVPLPRTIRKPSALQALFLELWRDPDHVLTATERSLLEEAKLLGAYTKRQKLLSSYPASVRARKLTELGAGAALYLGAAAALREAQEMAENTVDQKTYLGEPDYSALGVPKVELLVETTPFPHAAIRIGTKVYSYGVSNMTAKPVDEYLMRADDPLQAAPAAPDAEESYWRKALSFVGEKASQSAPRSVRVVELKLTPEETGALRRELELNTGKAYENVTGVNDCATMISRALAKNSPVKVPVLLDPYPSLVTSFLGVRKLLGDERVGRSRLITVDGDQPKALHILRNTYISMLEGKFALAMAGYHLPHRAYIAATRKPEELQYYEPEVQAELDAWKAKTRAEIDRNAKEYLPSKTYFSDLAQAPASARKQEQLAQAQELIGLILDPKLKEAQAFLDDTGADFQDIVTATAKVEALEEIRQGWMKELGLAAPAPPETR